MAELSCCALKQAATRLYSLMNSRCQTKGERGKISVVGGSVVYTGAPYFVAMAAEKTGADISRIFCHPSAAIPLKTLSPTLIVHPLFQQCDQWSNLEKQKFLRQISASDVIVLGPGLGYDESMVEIAKTVLQWSKEKNICLILDADVFRLPDDVLLLAKDNPHCIMTPNLKELNLAKVFIARVANDAEKKGPGSQQYRIKTSSSIETKKFRRLEQDKECLVETALQVFQFFKPHLLLIKGDQDCCIIDQHIFFGIRKGCLRRCGGQGDILAGCIAASVAASEKVLPPLNEIDSLKLSRKTLATLLASCVVRDACYRAENDTQNYISAVDILNYIQPTRYTEHFNLDNQNDCLLSVFDYDILATPTVSDL